jgi:hypothetical protein
MATTIVVAGPVLLPSEKYKNTYYLQIVTAFFAKWHVFWISMATEPASSDSNRLMNNGH